MMPGSMEVRLARRFFDALERADAATLTGLLDDRAVLRNMDGRVEARERAELAERLASRGDDVRYHLEEVAAAPGFARARFTLLVAEVPGGIRLDAHLTFAGERIVSIVVRPPDGEN